jgi:2-oxoglutarate dehydrogenase E2 component (dihydrolipoamide succinyltransferase)
VGSTNRTLLTDAATLFAPLALVLGARVFLAPIPSMASSTAASQQTLPPPAAAPAAAKLSPEQKKATDWLAALPSFKGLASPLDHPIAAVVPAPAPDPVAAAPDSPAPDPAPAVNPLAGLKLTGILGNDSGGLAAINGRVYRIGDTVRPGLVLTLIEAKTGTIVFKRDDGTELSLRRPPH